MAAEHTFAPAGPILWGALCNPTMLRLNCVSFKGLLGAWLVSSRTLLYSRDQVKRGGFCICKMTFKCKNCSKMVLNHDHLNLQPSHKVPKKSFRISRPGHRVYVRLTAASHKWLSQQIFIHKARPTCGPLQMQSYICSSLCLNTHIYIYIFIFKIRDVHVVISFFLTTS